MTETDAALTLPVSPLSNTGLRRRNALHWLLAPALCLLLAACNSLDHYRDATPEPDRRLDDLLILLTHSQQSGGHCLDISSPASALNDCDRLVVELERLHSDFPFHQRTLMTLATVHYQRQRRDRAQALLDALLDMPGAHPEAAILRSRIALEEGNTQGAAQVLLRQIMLRPDSGALRSALAAVYYAEGDIQRARNVLNSPAAQHPQPWLLSYHNGLLAEAEQRWLDACQLYLQTLQQQPGYAPALLRVIALAEHISCDEQSAGAAAPVTTFTTPLPTPLPAPSTAPLPAPAPSSATAPAAPAATAPSEQAAAPALPTLRLATPAQQPDTPAMPISDVTETALYRYAIQPGDTLWRIAGRLDSALPAQALMDWLFRNNPDAFIGENPNLLRADAELRLPSPLRH